MAGGGYEDKDLPPVYDLQHYVELSLLQSENKSAVSFAPVFTRIARSMDGSRSGSRELAISLQFKRAGADPTEGAVQIGDRQIGKQDTYTVRAETGRYPHESAWFTGVGVPAPTEAEGDARPVDAKSGGDAGGGGGGAVQGGNAPPQPHGAPAGNTATQNTAGDNSTADNKPKKEEAGPYPYTVTATVVETRPTRQFLAFIASVFTATQPAIESEIKGKIDSAQRRANESGDIDTQAAYREALGTAHSAITEYCALGDGDDKRAERWAKSGSASKAQLDANKAALAALVRPLPFSRENLIQVTGGKPTVDNARGCQGHI